MSVPADIFVEIAKYFDSWQEVVRIAGICREVRSKMRNVHWKTPFVAESKLQALLILSRYNFDVIDLNLLCDSFDFRYLGYRIAGIFNDAIGYTELQTSSRYIIEGLSELAPTRRFGKLVYYMHHKRVQPLESEDNDNMFNIYDLLNFAEIVLDGSSGIVGDQLMGYISTMVCYSEDCDILTFRKVNTCQTRVPVVKLVDCCPRTLYADCDTMYLINSTVYIDYGDGYMPDLKHLHIDKSSALVSYCPINAVFPNAEIICEDGGCIATCVRYIDTLDNVEKIHAFAKLHHNEDLYSNQSYDLQKNGYENVEKIVYGGEIHYYQDNPSNLDPDDEKYYGCSHFGDESDIYFEDINIIDEIDKCIYHMSNHRVCDEECDCSCNICYKK